MSSNSRLHLIPLVTGIVFPGTLIITYTISASTGTVKPFFSYISDHGAHPPASGVFTLLLFFCALGLSAVTFVRYKQVQEYFREKNNRLNSNLNKAGLILGVAASAGTTMVGSFQETHSFAPHVLGSFTAFFGGGLDLVIQAYFTFKMVPLFASKFLAWVRLVLAVMACILFLICVGTGYVARKEYKENGGPDPTRWEKKYGAWELRIISVVSEWIVAGFLAIYVLSFIPEFRKVSMEEFRFTIPRTSSSHSLQTPVNEGV